MKLFSSKKFVLLFVTVIAMSAFEQAALAAEPGVSAAQRFDHYLDDTRTLTANFTQTVIEADGEKSSIESGQLWLERPNRLRWDYEQPFKRSIAANGEEVWEYDADLRQAIVRPQGALIEKNPVILLGDRASVNEVFEQSGEFQAENLDWLELRPRSDAPEYRLVRLGFAKDELRVIEWVGAFDQQVRVVFSHIRRNQKITDERFKLALPKDTDVVRQDVF